MPLTWNQIAGLAVALLGYWGVRTALKAIQRRRTILNGGVRTLGTICELKRVPDPGGDGPDCYEPVVRFRTRGGNEHKVTLEPSTDTKRYAVGRTINIVHEAGNPGNAIAENSGGAIRIDLVLGLLFCLLALAVGLVLLSGKYGF